MHIFLVLLLTGVFCALVSRLTRQMLGALLLSSVAAILIIGSLWSTYGS